MTGIVSGDTFGPQPVFERGVPRTERTRAFANDLAFGRVGAGLSVAGEVVVFL
jgi:hypothetical protein